MLPLCYVMISKGKEIFPKMSKETNLLIFKVLVIIVLIKYNTGGKEKKRNSSNNFIYPPN